MTAHPMPQPGYNGLREPVATLPSSAYFDPDHYRRELKSIWYRNWLYVGRAAEIARPFSYKTFEIGDQNVLILRDEDGPLRAFHNTCRHRGSTLCREASGRLTSKLIVCPYHNWSYDLKGQLRRAPSMALPEGFDPKAYPLYEVALHDWRGFVFVNLAGKDAAPFATSFDRGAGRLDPWPLESLVVGHTFLTTIKCNWKVFWENYSECYHCPRVHPELCRLVPLYQQAVLSYSDTPDWQPQQPDDDGRPRVATGLQTWTMDGRSTLPVLPGLNESDIASGVSFASFTASMFVVAHPDYVRSVRVLPLGPESIELVVDWLLLPDTANDCAGEFERLFAVGRLLLEQDGRVCELNQQGLRSRRHEHGILVPQEYALWDFHQWLRAKLNRDRTEVPGRSINKGDACL